MHKLWLILKREYLTRVRTKAFVLSTASLPIFTIVVLLFSGALAKRQTDHPLRIGILDSVGGLAPRITQGLSEKSTGSPPVFQVVRSVERPANEEKAREEFSAQVRQGKLDGYVAVSRDALAGKAAEFHTKNPGDLPVTIPIRRVVTEAVIAQRLSDQGIHVPNLENAVRGIDITLVKVTEQGETEEKGQTFLLAIVMAIILYLSLLTYGIATMRSVLEEKSTRIVEILIASVRPSQLLAGKILGVAGVGLTQFLIWTGTGTLLAAYGTTLAAALHPQVPPPQLHLPASTLVYLVIYFLAGYFLYASLYASVGAMVSSEEDAQQAQWPVTALVVAAFMPFALILRHPNSTLSAALSMVPFFAPILMFMRIALQTPPVWQIALSLVILVLTTVGLVWVAAKIYRVGVLMYGKRPSLVEVYRWLKYT